MSFTTKDSGQRVEFSSGMKRDTEEGKTLYHLLYDGPLLQRWAELLTRGAKKYDEGNWMKASGEAEYNRFKKSAARHFYQWMTGDRDEDHAAAVVFNLNGAEYVRDKLGTATDTPLVVPEECRDEIQALMEAGAGDVVLIGKDCMGYADQYLAQERASTRAYHKELTKPSQQSRWWDELESTHWEHPRIPSGEAWDKLVAKVQADADEKLLTSFEPTVRTTVKGNWPYALISDGQDYPVNAVSDDPIDIRVVFAARHRQAVQDMADILEACAWTVPPAYPYISSELPSTPAPSLWSRVKTFVAHTLVSIAFNVAPTDAWNASQTESEMLYDEECSDDDWGF